MVYMGDPRGFVEVLRYAGRRRVDPLLTHRGKRAVGFIRDDLRAALESSALVSGLKDVSALDQAAEQSGHNFRGNKNIARERAFDHQSTCL